MLGRAGVLGHGKCHHGEAGAQPTYVDCHVVTCFPASMHYLPETLCCAGVCFIMINASKIKLLLIAWLHTVDVCVEQGAMLILR